MYIYTADRRKLLNAIEWLCEDWIGDQGLYVLGGRGLSEFELRVSVDGEWVHGETKLINAYNGRKAGSWEEVTVLGDSGMGMGKGEGSNQGGPREKLQGDYWSCERKTRGKLLG